MIILPVKKIDNNISETIENLEKIWRKSMWEIKVGIILNLLRESFRWLERYKNSSVFWE